MSLHPFGPDGLAECENCGDLVSVIFLDTKTFDECVDSAPHYVTESRWICRECDWRINNRTVHEY